MRLVIVDQSFVGVAGHHAEYTLCIAKKAAASASVVVLANGKCEVESSEGIEIRPTFRLPWTRPQRARPPAAYDATASFPAWSFLADLRRGLARLDLTPQDHVFIHSIGFVEIEDLLTLAMTTERSRLPVLDILLRRDLDEISADPPALKRFLAYAKAFAGLGFWPEHVRFFTDTLELSEQYAQATGIPFATLAIPFDQEAMRAALAERPPRTGEEPLIVGYLGDARPEKGYQFLPSVAAKLLYSHLLNGRVRLRLQSNYNLPGGETPAIPEARRRLERFGPAVELLIEPLEQDAYYRQLAEMDIVVLPYVAERYTKRSSGIFVQAVAAGKVVVVPRGTTMSAEAERHGMENCVVYDTPEDLPAAVAAAVDRYDELAAGTAYRERWCAANSPDALVASLLHEAPPAVGAERPLVLHVIDGHCAFYRTGTEAVQQTQRRFLEAAGYRVATVYLVRTHPSDADLDAWIERNYQYWFDTGSVFSWLVYYLQPPQQRPPRLAREIEDAELLSLPETLQGVIEAGMVDVIWMNKVAMTPLLDLLRVRHRIPAVLETHDIQSFQYAIENGREVDEQELGLELSLLDRFDRLISLSGPESLLMAGKLGRDRIATVVPPLLQEPLSVTDLAGTQDLGELVSSAGSDLPFVDFEQVQRSQEVWQFQALNQASSIDLLFVSSVHPPNMLSFDWFLDAVYAPKLASLGVTLLLAGSLSATDWARQRQQRFPDTLFLAGRVDSLRPLYAAARIVILPITHGAGVNIKTIEAMSLGKPIVATSLALRGLEGIEEKVATFDEPEAFAGRIVALLGDDALRRKEALRNWQLSAGQRDAQSYFDSLEAVFSSVLGRRPRSIAEPQEAREWEFVEWDLSIEILNRFARGLLERPPFLPDMAEPVERVLVVPGMRRTLSEILTSLICDRSARVLKTQSYLVKDRLSPLADVEGKSDIEQIRDLYVGALFPHSWVRPGLPLLAGCQRFPEVLRACGVAETDWKLEAALDIDVTVLAQDPQGRAHRVFVESFMQFYEECYVPHLAPKGVTLAVVGDLGMNVHLPSVFQIPQIANPAPLLMATRVVVAPWSELAVYHPAATAAMLQAITAGKPLVATPPALWFLDREEQDGFVAASPREFAGRVLDLLAAPAARLAATRKTWALADRLLAGVTEWQERQAAAAGAGARVRRLMTADIRFAEWGEWTRRCSTLIMKTLRHTALKREEIAGFAREMEDELAREAWEEMIAAMFDRRDAPILHSEAEPEAAEDHAVPRIRNLEEFGFEFKRLTFDAMEADRAIASFELAAPPASGTARRGVPEAAKPAAAQSNGSEPSGSEPSGSEPSGSEPNGGEPNGGAGFDPRFLLVKAGDQVAIDLSQAMPGTGWYPAERTGTGYHRWTGPEPRFTLEFFLPEQSYDCEIVMQPNTPGNFEDFAVTINEEPIACDHEIGDDRYIHLRFPVPGRSTGDYPPLSVLSFQHAAVSSPSDQGSADTRKLGFTVRSIAFSRAAVPSETAAAPAEPPPAALAEPPDEDLAAPPSEPPAPRRGRAPRLGSRRAPRHA